MVKKTYSNFFKIPVRSALLKSNQCNCTSRGDKSVGMRQVTNTYRLLEALDCLVHRYCVDICIQYRSCTVTPAGTLQQLCIAAPVFRSVVVYFKDVVIPCVQLFWTSDFRARITVVLFVDGKQQSYSSNTV